MNKRYERLLTAGLVLSRFANLSVLIVTLTVFPSTAPAQGSGTCFRPPLGLTGWWPLDDNADPLIGLSSGIPIGDPFFIPGQVGSGLFFDGVDDGLRIQSSPRPGTAGFTAECWIWPWHLASHQPILAWISPDGQPSVTLAIGDPQNSQPGSLWTGFRALDGVTRSFAVPSGLVVTGLWQHVALVYTRGSSNAAIYVNGSLVESGYVGIPLFQSAQTHQLRVANYSETNGSPEFGFFGGVDEITFYDRVLTSNQIASIFLAGAAGKCKDMLPPVVVAQPQNQSVSPGGTAIFSVTAQGTEPLLYRWRRNGLALSNSPNAPTLVISNVSVANVGAYSVLVTNGFGLSISSNAQLAIITNSVPPTIVSFGPSNLTVQAGGNAQFTVVANGTPPLSYRWEFDGIAIPGGTNATLLLSAVTAAQSGPYRCVVTNPFGSTATLPATLTVLDANLPVIVTQPQDQLVPQGGNAIFIVGATGAPPLSYQWYFLSSPIPGATSDTLDVPDVQPNQAGPYFAVVANASGAVTSSVALLNLILPPVISVQPQSQSVAEGSTTGFALSIGGTPPFDVQWYFNGALLPGATNNPLVLANVNGAQAGSYFARVANAAGETFSSNAVLTVFTCLRLTTTYSYSSWWPLDGDATDIAKTNNGILLGNPSFSAGLVGQGLELDGVDDSVLIPASSTLVAANVGTTNDGFTIEGWIRPTDVSRPQPIFAFQTPFGVAGPQLWLVGSQGGSPGALSAEFVDGAGQPQVITTPAGMVQSGSWQHVALVFSRFSASAIYLNGSSVTQRFVAASISNTSSPFNLRLGGVEGGPAFGGGLDEVQVFGRVLNPTQIYAIFAAGDSGKCKEALPPVMITHPQSQTVNAGASVTFRALAKGTEPLVYRWRRNSVTVGFGPELIIPFVTTTNAGSYSVVVSNHFGFVLSSNALLTVSSPSNVPPTITSLSPTSLTVTQGSTATFTVVASGSAPLSYQWLFNGNVLTGRVSSVLSLVGVQLAQSGAYSVVVGNSFGSVTSGVSTLTVTALPTPGQLVGFDSIWRYNDTGADLGTAWRDPGYNDSAWPSGPGLLGVETSVPFPYPVPLLTPVALGTNRLTHYFRTTFNFSGSPTSGVSLVSTSFVDDGAVFFLNGVEVSRLRVPQGQTFSTPASAGPAVEGTPEVAVLPAAILVNGVNTLAVEVHQTAVSSTDIVFGMNLVATAGNPPTPGLPVILVQPQSRTAALGSTTSFSVIATGAPPLLYQWHFNGNPLPSATSNVLTLVNVGSNSVGNYFAVVSNTNGSVTSAVATLTLSPPATNNAPRITSPTVVVTSNMVVGSAATFRVVASGATPLSYQWYRNGSPISGANADTLVLSNIQVEQAGTFFAVVANSFGAATNRGFILNVNDGQLGGVINFSLLGSSNAVVFERGTNLVPIGPTYLAQLYAGLTTEDLHPIGAAVPFNVPGRFSGGIRTITFVAAEVPVPVQVRVWECARGSTFEESLANGGRVGQSRIVQIIPRFAPNPPALLTGLSSFTLGFPPVAGSQSITMNEGTSTAIVLNASDPDGVPLSFDLSPPSHGTLSGTPPNVIYTPATCYFGPDSFSFTASDGMFTASATVTITVLQSQSPAVASFTVSPLAVISANQTNQLIVSPNNSNAPVVLDGSLSTAPGCGPLLFEWFDGDFPIVPFATGSVVTNEFSVGSHLVILAVTSDRNATGINAASFEVITAAEAVGTLIDQVSNANLPRNVKRPLLATLKASMTSFERGDFNTGHSQLNAFCNKVRSQIAPSDPALADVLITACRSIEAVFEN